MPPLTHRVSPLRPLFPILMAGAIAGIICITDALSLSALLFSGILAPYVGIASTLALLTTLIGGIIVSLWSSRPGSILTVQDVPTVMLTLTIGTSLKRLYVETNAAPELLMVLTTTIAMIALCTLLNGGMLYALGHFKLGNLMRYIPYPVVGGFLAGTGWLLCVGAMLMMTGLDDATQWRAWVQPDALMQWVPGVLFAIVLFQVLNRFTYFWLAPMVMFGAIALFYIILALFGISLDVARSHGLVFAFFSPQTTETSLTLASFTHIRWSLIVRHIGDLIAISVMSILSFLFNLSGIETTTPQEFDLNRELRVTGTANLASGLSGGMIGFHGVGVTALSGITAGKPTRLVGLVAATVVGLSLLSGPALVTLIPKFVFGGLTLYLGIDFLVEWVGKARHRFSPLDYGWILVILLTIATLGILPGVGIGLMVTVIAFVVRYSQFSPIKYELSGASHYSNLTRPLHQYHVLGAQGHQIWVLGLQGFIFFGTAYNLLNRVKEKLSHGLGMSNYLSASLLDQSIPNLTIRYIILDFSHVVNIDSSAVLSFTKMEQLVAQKEITLVLTNLNAHVQQILSQSDCFRQGFQQERATIQVFPDLDRGLEWCETEIIKTNTNWRRSRFLPMNLLLQEIFSQTDDILAFIGYLQKTQIRSEETIFSAGDIANQLHFIESGRVSEFLPLASADKTPRLRTCNAGTMIGAIAFYRNTPHQTTAIADQDTVLYSLSTEKLQQMNQETPHLAVSFQTYMASCLADQLSQATQNIKMLLS